jgi:multiple sugar transport system substrate-binding protein
VRRRTAAARRPLLLGALLLSLLLPAVTGCDGASHAAPQPTSSEDGPIVVASGLDVTGSTGVRQQLIQQWDDTPEGRRHPAQLVELPGSPDEQRSQLLGALQSGSADYDVVNLDITWVPEFADAGLIAPLEKQPYDTGFASSPSAAQLAPGDFVPTAAATGVWKKHTYALPFNSDVGLLYYRKDYLKAVGIDPAQYPHRGTTWSDLKKLMSTVALNAAKLPGPPPAGWTTQLATYEGLTVNTVEAFASADVPLADQDGHYLGSPAGLRRALPVLMDHTQRAYTLGDATKSREAESLSDFAAGRSVFLRHWPYAYSTLLQTFSADRIGVAPLPDAAVLGGQDLAVSAASPRAKYALDLVRYLTDKDNERCLLDAGFAASRTSSYLEDDGNATCPLPDRPAATATDPAARSGKGPVENHPMPTDAQGRPAYARSILYPALLAAVQRPRTPYYGAFTEALQSAMHQWITATAPIPLDGFADTLNRRLEDTLGGR